MVGSVLGERVQRKEDPKFLTTGGVYADDLRDPLLDDSAYVVFARSHIPHGVIRSIDIADALKMPGVISAFTADSLDLQPVPSEFNPNVARTLLASTKVRWVGEPLAAIVADTFEQALDAAEHVVADIDPVPPLMDVETALSSDVHIYDEMGGNVVFDSNMIGGRPNSGPEFFANCEVVVVQRMMNQRVAPCPLEPRAAAAVWSDERLNIWLSSQNAQGAQRAVAAACGVDLDKVHVRTPDVGGGFGAKGGRYSEELLLGVLARETGRAVRFRETRSESMVSLGHGRAQLQYVTIGGSRDGRVTHLQLELYQDTGGFCAVGTVLGAVMTRQMAAAVYDIPNVEAHCVSVATNTTPISAYRGAGRPEATAAAERAMDLFAAEIGMDPVEVRRKNLIPRFTEPITTAVGTTYDCGDYAKALDRVLAHADYEALRAEQRRRRDAGDKSLLGIGVSVYVEVTGGVPPMNETAKLEIHADGTGTIYTGTSPHGQGHDTSWSAIASAATGIDADHFTLVWGDTDRVPVGLGTMGSRSLQQGGAAVHAVSLALVERAKAIAARMLEADVADIVLDTTTGSFHVAGAPALGKSWVELGSVADPGELTEEGLFQASMPTYPFGAHLAVVEIDAETGQVRLIRHVACDDAGTVLNPLIVEGQVHGGVAQGVAQALYEEVRYDEDGNPVTSNLADYSMISIDLVPQIECVLTETPTHVNPLGAKGIGESGTIGATPAVHSAVIDAVSHLGVRHIDMPCTPEKVWQAIASAG